jgi:ubiquinone/menaquinone biosynthesis C-methylase UbiE
LSSLDAAPLVDSPVTDADALALLRAAIPAAAGETWADLGAGTGTFTRALATLVGPTGRVHAVDADGGALRVVESWAARSPGDRPVSTIRADVTQPLGLLPLDGVVMANVLHFVADAEATLRTVAAQLRPSGRLVLIEYEGRRPSRWVPHPVPTARFADLAAASGFATPEVVATRPSAYGGDLYVATAIRVG